MIARLKKMLLFLAITLLAAADGYAENEWTFPAGPSVETITMGSPVSLVLKKLGTPLRKVSVPPSEMGMPESQDLHYKGIVIGVYRSSGGQEPRVWSLRVNGEEVVVYPGITIGMTKQELIMLLGKPDSDEIREDGQRLFWTAPEPVEIFYVRLRHDRVIEFAMMEDWS